MFPVVLTPNLKLTKTVELTEAIKANRSWLDSLLHRSGAVLFRGFSVSSASDFNDVVESSGYEDFSYGVGGAGSRTKVIGRVYTANEAPPDQDIPFHHEMSHCSVTVNEDATSGKTERPSQSVSVIQHYIEGRGKESGSSSSVEGTSTQENGGRSEKGNMPVIELECLDDKLLEELLGN
ncbi:tauD/TfdA-like domain-containing protein [Artemisia annua]|uniref:TauD/TfdA-like domain-containing protein n=1 Tax=Artemisia annua TaxID=35608 RepID=A0A2U1NZX5_ARTAN|nr:tauD/TfdA-like domain-containing protein [Artemisia annua]